MKKGIIIMAALLSTVALAACGDASSSTPAESSSTVVSEETSSAVGIVSSETAQSSSEASAETSSASEAVSSTLSGQTSALSDSTLTATLPDGFSYNDGWSCWSDADYQTSIWLKDANLYENASDMKTFIENKEYQTITCGDYTVYAVENPSGTYGAETQYYIDFGKDVGGYKACRILISNNQKDLSKTQSQEIQNMIAGISAS